MHHKLRINVFLVAALWIAPLSGCGDNRASNDGPTISSDPNIDALRSIGEEAYASNRLPEAIAALEELTKKAPNDSDAWRRLAQAHSRNGQPARGREAALKATETDPKNLLAWTVLTTIDTRLGRLEEAQSAVEKALSLNPEDSSALRLSAVLALKRNPTPDALARAEKQISRSIALDPYGKAYVVRGRIYLAQKKTALAIEEFKAALTLDPSIQDAHLHLAQAYAATGDAKSAHEEMARYEAMSPPAETEGRAAR